MRDLKYSCTSFPMTSKYLSQRLCQAHDVRVDVIAISTNVPDPMFASSLKHYEYEIVLCHSAESYFEVNCTPGSVFLFSDRKDRSLHYNV